MADWIAKRRTAQDSIVYLWPDGSLTWAFGRFVDGSPRARTPEQVERALSAGWLAMGDVELYDDAEVPQLIRAARWAVEHGTGIAGMRERFHRAVPLRPAWTTLQTDRTGKPTLQCWRLPRLRWPGLAVWRESGRYSIWTEQGRSGTYAPTGLSFTNLSALRAHLDST